MHEIVLRLSKCKCGKLCIHTLGPAINQWHGQVVTATPGYHSSTHLEPSIITLCSPKTWIGMGDRRLDECTSCRCVSNGAVAARAASEVLRPQKGGKSAYQLPQTERKRTADTASMKGRSQQWVMTSLMALRLPLMAYLCRQSHCKKVSGPESFLTAIQLNNNY